MSLDVFLEIRRDPDDVFAEEVFYANITHNLNRMAMEAGIYKALWRPEEVGFTHARDLIEPLTHGLELLKSDPAKYKALDPDNGWGSYDGCVPWIEKYLKACRDYPDATVAVSR
jgi:hypothetical protein